MFVAILADKKAKLPQLCHHRLAADGRLPGGEQQVAEKKNRSPMSSLSAITNSGGKPARSRRILAICGASSRAYCSMARSPPSARVFDRCRNQGLDQRRPLADEPCPAVAGQNILPRVARPSLVNPLVCANNKRLSHITPLRHRSIREVDNASVFHLEQGRSVAGAVTHRPVWPLAFR